jgi:hypothetical protein
MMAAPVAVTRSTFEPGAPVRLFPTRIVGGAGTPTGREYDVALDGVTPLVAKGLTEEPPRPSDWLILR